jgi:leader peptidase (prepilin peptidase)/N-methyltransferase
MRVLVFWLGAVFGSFLNVVAYRVPKGRSVVGGRSHCPHCRALIAAYDNIPILSWFYLGGKCRKCRKPFSFRYPAVELVTACLALALWIRWDGVLPWAVLAVLAAGDLVAVTLIDWDTFLIPDGLSLGLLAAGLAVSPFNPLLAGGEHPWSATLVSFRGAVTGFVLCWLVAEGGARIFGKEAMGGGDIKLLAAVGAWSGALGAFDCLMVGSMLGSVYGIALMSTGKLKRSDPIPFGPFLSAGAQRGRDPELFLRPAAGLPFLLTR